jgi:hypothetical protein
MQLNCKATIVGMLALVASGASAQMSATDTIKPLLLEAIRHGQAQGELGGQAREAMVQLFKSTAPIVISVERLASLETDGCYRLKVTTTQAGVYEFDPKTRVRNATPSDQRMAYKVSYCANGHFPEEGGGL